MVRTLQTPVYISTIKPSPFSSQTTPAAPGHLRTAPQDLTNGRHTVSAGDNVLSMDWYDSHHVGDGVYVRHDDYELVKST